ncbi:uncharacterized protein N7443_001922 [Penicillium atrosanguineum]|uniref:uncharacterized protein n=1 Tax=Penicillium atrosanguineum TaxID=1132637 RepID=UPI00238582D3|nr:uncharacterized protein N7443_001922 [Penicillium atrosanguineum]KAJ5309461.1 hypothetical protein N7443_001922 [Penicillium atrosanguineum]
MTSANSNTNHYTVLGVDRNATLPEIRSAYKKLALKLHPDKAGDSKETTARFRKVAEAVDILSNPVFRRKHDEILDRSALTDPGLENFWDKFGIRPGYASPATTDDEYWTGRWNANHHRHWSSRPWEAPYAKSRENPYDEHPRRPRPTQPCPAQPREPSPPRKSDIWEEYLNGSRQNGMKYGPNTTNAFPAYNKWQQKPLSKQKFQGIFREEPIPEASKTGVPSRRGAPLQTANSAHSHQRAHEEKLKQKDLLEINLSTSHHGFGNIHTVPDNDEGNLNPTHTADFQGAEYKCRVHVSVDDPSVQSSAADGEDGLLDEDCGPRPSFPSQGDGSTDGRTDLFNDNRPSLTDEKVFFSSVGFPDSPDSAEFGELVDSAKLTGDDSDGGVPLPAETPVDNADEEPDDKSGDFKSFFPFVPFYRKKLRESNGQYTSNDLYSELEGLVKQAFDNAQRRKEEALSNPNPILSPTPNDVKVCSQVDLWVRRFDRRECKVCNIFKPLYVLECSGCDATACVRCKFQKTA